MKNQIKSNKPQAVLFVCNLNSIRSPIAEAILKVWFNKKIFVDSCGIRPGSIDHMAIEVMAEKNYNLSHHQSKLLKNLDDSYFDLIITFTNEAYNKAIEFTKTSFCEVEYFEVPDASQTIGNREQRLESYRFVRDKMILILKKRFNNYNEN